MDNKSHSRRAFVEVPIPDDLFELDACARQLLRARAGMDLHLGRMLRIFQSLDLARHLGYSGFGSYVEERLGISASRAKSLVTLDRLLTDLAEVEEAVRKGQVGTVAALAIARIARRGPSERAWVRRARTRTLSRLRKEVAWAETRAERDPGFEFMPPPTAPLSSDLAEVTARVSPEAAERTRGVRDHEPWVRLTGDPSIDDDPLEDDPPRGTASDGQESAGQVRAAATGDGGVTPPDVAGGTGEQPQDGRKSAGEIVGEGSDGGRDAAGHAAERCGQPAEGQESAETAASDSVTGVSRFARRGVDFESADPDEGPLVRVRFCLRRSATADWSEARRRIASECESWHVPDRRVLFEIAVAFLRTWLPDWIDALTSQDPTAVRDRFCCQMPGCPRRRGSGHHLWFQSRGGPDDLWNLLFLCETCHLEAIHRVRSIRVRGRAPDLLVAEVGVRPDGRPLEVYLRRPFRYGVATPDYPAAPSAA